MYSCPSSSVLGFYCYESGMHEFRGCFVRHSISVVSTKISQTHSNHAVKRIGYRALGVGGTIYYVYGIDSLPS